MANLKVTILHDVWEEGPPEPEPEPVKAPRGKNGKRRKKKKDPLHDREEIFEALTKLGHEPSYHVLDGKNQSLLALAKVRRRPRLQPHGVLRRRRHDGQEHRRLSGTAAHSVYRRRPAGSLSCPGQVDRKKDLRLSQDQDAGLRDLL